ncbi:MAG: hypothetical protein R3242_11140, partial [Akkermansiaceae bacterium]|nr:hypothetical protein [Akkermansiaceae bacterium]
MKHLALVLLLSGLTSFPLHAEVIASQDFNSENFPTVLSLQNSWVGSLVTHTGSGSAGTDLGFSATGQTVRDEPGKTPLFEVSDGRVGFSHFHAQSYASSALNVQLLSGASTIWHANHTAILYTTTVDLSRHDNCTFSMDVGDLENYTNNDRHNIIVRLWINGDTEVTLVDTRPNSTGELTYGTITHTFADSDTSAQLLVDLRSDSAGSGYRLDN